MAGPTLMGSKQKAASAAKAAPAAAKSTRWWRVLEDKQVPRQGGHDMLRAGKEINGASYDVDNLRKMGVKLEEIDPPGWFVQAQEESKGRHAGLVAAGHDLGEHPEYKPTQVASAEDPAKTPPSAT